MAPSRGRRRRGGRAGRPWPCRRCTQPILWATVRMLNGSRRKIPVNATPVPHGTYEYVAGTTLRPVLRELDTHELLAPPDGDRYVSHLRYCPPLSVDVPDDPVDARAGERAR